MNELSNYSLSHSIVAWAILIASIALLIVVVKRRK